MRLLALRGVRRGRSVTTTLRDRAQPCPLDHVNRQSGNRHRRFALLSDTSGNNLADRLVAIAVFGNDHA